MDITAETLPCNPADMSATMAQVYALWRSECGTAPGPNWKSTDLIRLPGDVIPWSSLLDITGTESEHMVFRYWGSNRASMTGMDLTGLALSVVRPDFLRDKVLNEYRQVLDTAAPVYVKTTVTRRGDPVSYEVLRAPLSSNGREITGLFSTLLYVGDVFMTSETLFQST